MITLSAFGDEISPDLDTQLDVMQSEGIQYLDLRSVEHKNVIDLTDEEASEIKKRLDDRGIKVASIASPVAKVSISEPLAAEVTKLRRAIKLAKFFGTPYVRIFTFVTPKEDGPYLYRDEVHRRMKELARIAEQEDITLLIDNEGYGDNGERLKDIFEYVNSPNLRLAFDPANFIVSMVLPMTDAYPIVEPYISYFHIKDARVNTGEIVPAGEGDAQIRELLARLKQTGYSGFMSIEPKGGGEHPDFFIKAAGAFKRLLDEADIEWRNSNAAAYTYQDLIQTVIPPCPSPMPAENDKTWIPLTPLEKMAEENYDVLIVGTGAGGGAALWRLCEQWGNKGKKIGVIEAGDLLLPTHASNLDILSHGRASRFISSNARHIGEDLPEFPGAKQLIALGGRTLQWSALALRMPRFVTDTWPIPPEEMEIYYKIAEHMMNVNSNYAMRNGSASWIILQRLWENGYPEAAYMPFAVDLAPVQNGEIHTDLWFSSIDFLSKARNRMPFDLAANARAVKIAANDGNVTGITVMSQDKRAYELHAKAVILSASTFETPRLLLHSGIPGKTIGHYLTDNISTRSSAELLRKEMPENIGPLDVYIPKRLDSPVQIQFSWQAEAEKILLGANGYGLMEPRYENMVFLNPDKIDEYGVPEIQVQFTFSPKDLQMLRGMAEDVQRAFSAIGAAVTDMDGGSIICLRPPGESNHESGTCRMGTDPSTSAADPYGQIHGIHGLFVADNSILPDLWSNPTLTTVALAIRTADYIVSQLRK
ncbi:TIM barrel protein [Paenibacillus sp. N4]|uniref:TIM barrel protein n=1 Tax=Paenibacillus vietnamensis TaxID=2590547 RepID=UPI001CD10015|nr:TIM barrel protein [Paenibacillus vietnamensis]MCA0754231.1 TIM barrel protein [Paenibacillus vietnamensis]